MQYCIRLYCFRRKEENAVSELDVLLLRIFSQVKAEDLICLMNVYVTPVLTHL